MPKIKILINDKKIYLTLVNILKFTKREFKRKKSEINVFFFIFNQ